MTNSNLLIIDNLFLISMFIVGVPIILISIYFLAKSCYKYLKEGNYQLTSLSVSYCYIILMVTESLLFMVLSCANDFCIISLKLFVLVNSFLYVKTRFTGKATLSIKRSTRAFLFLIVMTFFWIVIGIFSITSEKTYVFDNDISSFYKKLIQIVQFISYPIGEGRIKVFQFLLCSVPPFIFNLIALLIDIKEMKPKNNIINSAHMFIPSVMNAYLLLYPFIFGNSDNFAFNIFNICILMVMCVVMCYCMIREGWLMVFYDELSTPEMLIGKLHDEIIKEKNENIKNRKIQMAKKIYLEDCSDIKFKDKKLLKYVQNL